MAPALTDEMTSLVESSLELVEVNQGLAGFLADIAGLFKCRGQAEAPRPTADDFSSAWRALIMAARAA